MPLDHVVIALPRNGNQWINVLMLNTGGDGDANWKIDIGSSCFRWIENGVEQRLSMEKYFAINSSATVNSFDESPFSTFFGLSLLHLHRENIDRDTVNVKISPLRLQFDETTICALHCSHCGIALTSAQRFNPIRPVPIYTLMPIHYFNPQGLPAIELQERELFFGLNHIVSHPRLLGNRKIHCKQNVHCKRCLQLLGVVLAEGKSVLLYADTLSLARFTEDELPPEHMTRLFCNVSPVQIILRLLHDALPISMDKTRLFLKTVRPDGQLHYMLLVVDTNQVHLLRSKYSLADDLQDGRQLANWSRNSEGLRVQEVEMLGFKGCRIHYQVFCTDEELRENHDLIEVWLSAGTPMLRISYMMMVDLISALNMNERIVKTIEKITPSDMPGRFSYIIYEPDNDF